MLTGVNRKFRAVREVRHDLVEKPFLAIWEVTRACQLVCKHCRADSQRSAAPGQLSTEEGKKLLRDLASYPKPYPLVVLSGGDPFERPDLEELVRYGVGLGLHMSLSPSVTPKVTRERLAALREAGAVGLSLSLDGGTAPTHDAFRGFSGTFDATIEAARVVSDLGYRLQINSTVTRRTIREAPELLAEVIAMNAHLWSVFFIVPTGRGEALGGLSAAEREDAMWWLADISDRIAVKTTEAPQFRRIMLQRRKGHTYTGGELYEFLTRRTEELLGDDFTPRRPRPPLAINSGRGFVFIDHVGDVYPSGFLPLHCGNVKEKSLCQIYAEASTFQALRDPSRWRGKCGVCEFNRVCGGSRSTAYSMTGDALASDPTCLYEPAPAAVGSPAWN